TRVVTSPSTPASATTSSRKRCGSPSGPNARRTGPPVTGAGTFSATVATTAGSPSRRAHSSVAGTTAPEVSDGSTQPRTPRPPPPPSRKRCGSPAGPNARRTGPPVTGAGTFSATVATTAGSPSRRAHSSVAGTTAPEVSDGSTQPRTPRPPPTGRTYGQVRIS